MRFQEHINTIYFHNEFTGRKYLKQHIVMKIYNSQLKGWKQAYSQIRGYNEPMPTLSSVWNEVNAYFGAMGAKFHTCEYPSNPNAWVKMSRLNGWSID